MPDFTIFKDYAKNRQATKDLSIHATKQMIALMERTVDLLDNPLSATMICHDMALCAVTGAAAHLVKAAAQEGYHMPMEIALQLAMKHLNGELVQMHKFMAKNGIR